MDSVSVAFELMQLELENEVEYLNSDGAECFKNSRYQQASELSERGKTLARFCDNVKALAGQWHSEFSDDFPQDEIKSLETARSIQSSTKSAKTRLIVMFEDGKTIQYPKAADTMAETFRVMGFEKVCTTNVVVNREPIVSRARSEKHIYNDTEMDGYFVKTHSNTVQKKKNIEDVAKQLGIPIKVEVI